MQSMKAGAMDFLEKPFSEQVLLDCIEHAMAHDAQRRQEQAWHTTFAARLARLTPREREVLDLVLVGLLNSTGVGSCRSCMPNPLRISRARCSGRRVRRNRDIDTYISRLDFLE